MCVQTGVSLPLRRALAVPAVLQWRLALAALFAGSAAVRTWAGWRHVTPNYFPDENTYASLARSLAAGHLPSVRGHVAHFPALLEPILTAPAWWFGSLETGYRITQAIDAVAMSTAALLAWWAARRLGAARGPALAAAALTVAVPDLTYSGWILSEPFAYPLFVGAVGAGAVALARPTRRTQLLVAAFVLAASFARLQLAILVPAYLVAALLLRKLRAQRVVVGAFAGALAIVAVAVAGFYRHATVHAVSPAELGRNSFVLALAAGWIVVPAGLLGLAGAWLRPASAEQRAFAALALTAGGGVLLEATLYSDPSVVHERYALYVLPILFIGFALHATRGWPWPRAHGVLAVAMLLAAATVTVAGWSSAHSLTLVAVHELQRRAGSPGQAGLVVALVTGALSLLSVVCAWRRQTAVAAAAALAFCVAASALAVSFDTRNSHNVRRSFLPDGANWVAGPATLTVGPAPRPSVFSQLFWNHGVTGIALFGNVADPDTFAASFTGVDKRGRLVGIRGRVVLDESGAALVPVQPLRANAQWLEARTPWLAAEVDGRYGDGWLAPAGRIRLFRGGGALTFTVTAPERTTLTLGDRTIRLAQGVPTRVVVRSRELRYRFSTAGWAGLRRVSARSSFPLWRP